MILHRLDQIINLLKQIVAQIGKDDDFSAEDASVKNMTEKIHEAKSRIPTTNQGE